MALVMAWHVVVCAVAAEGILKLFDLTFHVMEHKLISFNNQANLLAWLYEWTKSTKEIFRWFPAFYGLAISQLHYGTQAYTELLHV